jgi:hypothetical protein
MWAAAVSELKQGKTVAPSWLRFKLRAPGRSQRNSPAEAAGLSAQHVVTLDRASGASRRFTLGERPSGSQVGLSRHKLKEVLANQEKPHE